MRWEDSFSALAVEQGWTAQVLPETDLSIRFGLFKLRPVIMKQTGSLFYLFLFFPFG
jgi:hypothetical protein